MKKVIFLSAIALAAAVSCSKSEVVDTKFESEAIGFETYLGRDAQTKATVESIKTIGKVGVYGYYLGATNTFDAAAEDANLWNPLTLVINNDGTVVPPSGTDIRYWTNTTDYYTFLAYAPMDKVSVTAGTNGENPTIGYVHTNQVDVLCAEPHICRQKGNGTVDLKLEHKLARLTVKARAEYGNFDFHIKSIVITGKFNTEGELPLASPTAWTELISVEGTQYSFQTVATDALPKPTAKGGSVEYKDYSGTVTNGTTTTHGNNYIMLIPVLATQHAAKLKVVYSTSYMAGDRKIESIDYEKEFPITSNFDMGMAYALALDFAQAADNAINFSVSEVGWDSQSDITMQL